MSENLTQQIMSAMGNDGVQKVAGMLGTDQGQASDALGSAVSTLLGGMAVNSTDPQGASSLFEAIGQHTADPDPTQAIANADTADGEKIVQHVLGGQTDTAAQAIGQKSGIDASAITKLLPAVAPMVMSFLGRRMQGGRLGAQDVAQELQSQTAQSAQADPGIGGLLSSILGGSKGAGGGLGAILGGR